LRRNTGACWLACFLLNLFLSISGFNPFNRLDEHLAMWNSTINKTTAISCHFCGLGCDDLHIAFDNQQLHRLDNGCTLARQAFAEAIENSAQEVKIEGQPSTLEQALEHSATLLKSARAPLFGGLATDVNGMRALLQLADIAGAQLDHMQGDALFRNLQVLQDKGWFTTTFTEVRNRADLIVIVGNQCLERFPRIIERVFFPEHSLYSPAADRKLVLLGPWDEARLPTALKVHKPTIIPIELNRLAEAGGLLRGLIAGRPVDPAALDGVAGYQLEALAEDLVAAKYSVVSWSAAELDFPHAELTVQSLVELVRDLNVTTRSAALPLAGAQGEITASQVCTWQTGYPPRISLQRGFPEYDPQRYRHQTLLEQNQIDLLLWVSSLRAQAAPPVTKAPTIVLGHPAMVFEHTPDVFIPVGIPGIDHPGHGYRGDAVFAQPLGQLRASDLPSVNQVVSALSQRLQQKDTL
jgi:formylmethanofuran dehydrogenase subunit B